MGRLLKEPNLSLTPTFYEVQDDACTENRLFKAAQKLFAAHGFSATSISQIAKEAGVSQGLIYHYVKSKEELWERIMEDVYQKRIVVPQGKAIETLEDFLNIFVKNRLNSISHNSDFSRIISWQLLESSLGLGEFYRKTEGNKWIHILTKLQKKGEVCSQSEANFLFFIILALTSGPWISALLEEEDLYTKERNISTLIHISRRILKAMPFPYEPRSPT